MPHVWGGLRLLECARLRIKDLDFDRNEITIHDGKGRKDRVTVFPARLTQPLRKHLERIRAQHPRDLASGAGGVALPYALDRNGSSPRLGSMSTRTRASFAVTTFTKA